MILSFELSMPNNNSWNGKWNDEIMYAKVINFGKSKKGIEKATEILSKKSFSYNFGDGWTARITVKKVDVKEAAFIRRYSRGFYGYDWMVDSIKFDLEIIAPSQRQSKEKI